MSVLVSVVVVAVSVRVRVNARVNMRARVSVRDSGKSKVKMWADSTGQLHPVTIMGCIIGVYYVG